MNKIFVEQIDDTKKQELQIPESCQVSGPWSVWECEPSKFDWHYDSVELAYIYEGEVKVKIGEEAVDIKAGDFVTFPAGLDCSWDIISKIRKVYQFI